VTTRSGMSSSASGDRLTTLRMASTLSRCSGLLHALAPGKSFAPSFGSSRATSSKTTPATS
jgi:hypothetical protein